jgi:iron(II)-dependent oxidoreductase
MFGNGPIRDFVPFGFSADPYEDYSQPWFNTRKVLRGGSFAATVRIARLGYRNFFAPDRNDVIAGFRSCVLCCGGTRTLSRTRPP